MFKKILRFITRFVVGLILFYLIFGFVILPLALTWGIQSQGTKILKHPVKVKSVYFNPLTLKLNIRGFEILDNDKKVMAGFESFGVNVSFLGLLKKVYRVESLNMDGLVINVVMASGGKIDLLDLVPAAPVAQPPTSQPVAPAQPPANEPSKPAQPMPLVIVDDFVMRKGIVRFEDQTITPVFKAALNDMNLHITGLSTQPDSLAKITFQSKLDESGAISLEAAAKPFVQPLEAETTFQLNNYALQILTPYVGKYTGRAVGDGKFDLKMDYRISNNKLTASHKVLVQNFDFGDKVESKDALSLPFGLVVALLEDPQGKINISLPVNGDMSDPEFHYFHLIGQVVSNFFVKLMTKPFTFLASIIGSESGSDELGYARFVTGKADLSDEEKVKLSTLVKGLKERPKLRLEINGSYDPELDWKAIKTDIFNKNFSDLKAESTKMESWVYQQLYQRRFGVRALWSLTQKYKIKKNVYDEEKMNAEIKRQLIEDSSADKIAMEALAQARAKLVYDFILSEGFDANRVSIGQPREVQGSMGFVPLEFTLTVFEK